MKTFKIIDRSKLDDVGELTPQGFLKVKANIARSGIQEYYAAEFPGIFKDKDPTDIIKVYRPADVVLSKEKLAQYENAPITDGHPWEDVSVDNAEYLIKGHVTSSIESKDGYAQAWLIIHDKDLIFDIQNKRKDEFSAGYSMDAKIESGITEDEQPYDMIVTDQTINHVAVVKQARCGKSCSVVNDSKTIKGDNMVKVKVGDQEFEIPGVVADHISMLKTENADLTGKVKTFDGEKGALEAENAKLKAENQSLKDQEMSPEKLDALADERGLVKDNVKTLLGDKAENFTFDNKSCTQIKRDAIMAYDEKAISKDVSDEYVNAYFDVLTKNIVDEKTNLDEKGRRMSDSNAGGSPNSMSVTDARNKARENYEKTIFNRHETEGAS